MQQGRLKQAAQRLGWFAALWLAGVICVSAVAYAIRWAIL